MFRFRWLAAAICVPVLFSSWACVSILGDYDAQAGAGGSGGTLAASTSTGLGGSVSSVSVSGSGGQSVASSVSSAGSGGSGGGVTSSSSVGSTGGGGSGGGAPACNATNCANGCCDNSDQCVTQLTNSVCGFGGVACAACNAESDCSAGVCLGCGASTKITAPDAAQNDLFGNSVAASPTTVVVGAPAHGGMGAAYVFTGSTWKIQSSSGGAALLPDDSVMGQYFGANVAVSGDTALVSANPNSMPYLYIFTRQGSTWLKAQKLVQPSSLNALAIQDGTALIGNSYSATMMTTTTSWNTLTTQTLSPDDFTPANLDGFGSPIAIDGNTAVIGAVRFDADGNATRSAYVFVRSGATWTLQQKIFATELMSNNSPSTRYTLALSGNTIVMATSIGGFIFERVGSTWTESTTTLPVTPTGSYANSASASGAGLLVSAPDFVGGKGSVLLYGHAGSNWPTATPLASGVQGDAFGGSVSLNGSVAIVGATGDNLMGAAYVYSCSP